jgi:chemotaxis signal transduction protein
VTATHPAPLLGGPDVEHAARDEAMLLVRIGRERFACALTAAEEALEWPAVDEIPGARTAMLGVFAHRGQLVPLHSPARALGVTHAQAQGVVVIMNTRGRRVGLALDEVEDVIMVDRTQMQRPPVPDAAGRVVLGVIRHGDHLVSIIDAAELVAVCAGDPVEGGA